MVALLVFGSPLAVAGTEQDPEVSDPASDESPRVQGVSESADLLAVWVRTPNTTTAEIGMKVSRLDTATRGAFEVTWHVRDRFGLSVGNSYQGARADVDRGAADFTLLCAANEDFHPGACPKQAGISGELRLGLPGTILWSIDREEVIRSFEHGYVLDDFQASAETFPVTATDQAHMTDTARGENRTFEVIDFGHPEFPSFEPPTRPPDYGDDEGDVENSSADILGVWLEFGAESIDFVVKLGRFSLREPPFCGWSSTFQINSRKGSDYLSAHVSLESGLELPSKPPTLAFEKGYLEATKGSFAILEGEPAYARYRLASGDWAGRRDPHSLGFGGQTTCWGANADGSAVVAYQDSIVYYRDTIPSFLAPFTLTCLLGIAFGVRRRRALF